MTPQSLPEFETPEFRRAIAVALGLPIEGEPPRRAAEGAVVVAATGDEPNDLGADAEQAPAAEPLDEAA